MKMTALSLNLKSPFFIKGVINLDFKVNCGPRYMKMTPLSLNLERPITCKRDNDDTVFIYRNISFCLSPFVFDIDCSVI